MGPDLHDSRGRMELTGVRSDLGKDHPKFLSSCDPLQSAGCWVECKRSLTVASRAVDMGVRLSSSVCTKNSRIDLKI